MSLFLFGTFSGHWVVFFKRGAVLGALVALPVTAANWSLPALAAQPVALPIWIGLGADVTGLFFLCALYIYAYPLIVLYDIGVVAAFRNSLILVVRYLSNTLGLVGMAVLLGYLTYQVSAFLLLVLPATWMVFVINNCRMTVRQELGGNDAPDDTQPME